MTAIPATAERQTQFVESKLIVTDGSTVCPSPGRCDSFEHERHETYIRRHCRDHQLGEFAHGPAGILDAERNLFLNCFYYAAKYGLGNHSINPFPFWEHCTFMSEWSFHPDDLEQGHPRETRTWRLPDYEHMRAGRVTKRFKKIEKPRGSLKTSIGRAYVTWRLIRAYFVENNPAYRVLVISAASRIGRAQWFKPLKQLWSSGPQIMRLFGAWEFTCDTCGVRQTVPQPLRPGLDDCPRCKADRHEFRACKGCDDKRYHREGEQREEFKPHCNECAQPKYACQTGARIGDRVRCRQLGILTKGSSGTDSVSLRWTVITQDASRTGMAVENFQFGGVGTELTGQRFDLVMADDLSTDKNSYSLPRRQEVEETVSQVRAQLDRGQFILSCTRKHLEDFAGKVEQKTGPLFAQFHIMSRRASWLDQQTGETVYYWATDAEGKPRLDEKKLAEELHGNSERFFYSEYMNEPQDPTKSSFRSEWFEPIDDAQVPAPVLWGLNRDYTDEELRMIREQGIVVDSVLYVDPAGHEEQKARNDRTALFGIRVYQGTVYVCLLRSMQGSDSAEKEEIYNAAMYLRPRRIRYERKVNEKRDGLENGFANFCRQKSLELTRALGRPVTVNLPMHFVAPSTIVSKRDKIEKTEPLWRSGRVKILRSADPSGIEHARCRDQYVGLGITTHDDYPDAGSGMQEDVGIPTMATVREAEDAVAGAQVNSRGNLEVNAASMLTQMFERRSGEASKNWGVKGAGGASRSRRY